MVVDYFRRIKKANETNTKRLAQMASLEGYERYILREGDVQRTLTGEANDRNCGSDDFVADAERTLVVVPIGAEKLETTNLGCGADMLADAGTDVEVTDAHEANGL